MALYDIVAASEFRLAIYLDRPLDGAELKTLAAEMIRAGVEEHFGMVRDISVEIQAIAPSELET
ncbi:MAG: hypothetical protein JWO66_2547 [Candidatus Eremiobacteraeota bacterium]|nr:hypothetical protein [Candidatus Eremiobacteraeota bacterium]